MKKKIGAKNMSWIDGERGIMQDINKGEKERLYQWACEYHTKEIEERYFTRIDKECESYFEKRDPKEKYGREYVFQTIPELRKELEIMWDGDETMEQIMKAVLVASMKNKPMPEENNDTAASNPEELKEQIKSYIYNF